MSTIKKGCADCGKSKPLAYIICEEVHLAAEEYNDADGSAEFAYLLGNALSSMFNVAPIIRCGEDLWERLFIELPDIIVISQTFRDIDALSLIRSLKLSKYGFDIRFFLCCKTVNKSVESICKHHDIDGAFSVFDSIEDAVRMIEEKYAELAKNAAERRIRTLQSFMDDSLYFGDSARGRYSLKSIEQSLLAPLGFDDTLSGYKYLKLLILMRVFGIEAAMTELYSLVGECFGVSRASVEKAIRYSIEKAWERSTPYMQYLLFGNTTDADRGKPTNREFVETAVIHANELIRGGRKDRFDQ